MDVRLCARASEPSFPKRLRCLVDVEKVELIEAEGTLAASLDDLGPTVAIVGTRNPPRGAAEWTRALARSLAQAGCCIVSGGALGIDTAAHEGALDAGRVTLAVLGGGVDVCYPRENEALFARIRASGALVSIQPRGSPPIGFFLLRRNSVIAALADLVVMVSAPIGSGARSTVKHARNLGRPIWVLPGAPWDPFFEGSLIELARRNTNLLLHGDQLLVALGLLEAKPEKACRAPTSRRASSRGRRGRCPSSSPPLPLFPSARFGIKGLSAREHDTLIALQRGPVSLEQLVLETGLDVGSLRALLLTWTVEGVVREGPSGLFRLTSN